MNSLGQLPDLSSPYPVPEASVAELREKGHTLLRQVATADEMAAWGPYIREVALRNSEEDRPVEQRDTLLRRAFLQIQNLWWADETMRRFTLAERFGRIAADLLGVDAVRIYHDQAIFKEPGGALTPWHQDQYYFPLDGDDVITMWMPLTDVTPEMGSLVYASGSQRLGYLGEFEASEQSEAVFRKMIAETGMELESPGPMKAGDATWHTSWTLHGAPANPTDTMRAAMTVIWMADGLRGIEPQHEWHSKDYEKWMPDVHPGELAAGRLNPLVWRRS
ncbi:MAG: phytanoyl-CoA dioxygenase family protein [Actinobacteria bacterium]|nr:phytanoyl-CoA dioxygenase family protein [Actinomycetota bacterium]